MTTVAEDPTGGGMPSRRDPDVRAPRKRTVGLDTRLRALLAFALGVAATTGLSLGHRSVGYVRDEGVYFLAGRSYAKWWSEVARDPRIAFEREGRDRAFGVNHEHPPLVKTAMGLTERVWGAGAVSSGTSDGAREPGGSPKGLPDGAAARLAPQAIAGLGVGLLFFVGSAFGLTAGLLAALWCFALPHVWFHAGLGCFDVPVAVAIFALTLVYRRALVSWRYALALGPLLGVAVLTKHNALFAAPLFVGHYAWCLVWHGVRARTWPRFGQLCPLFVVSMVTLAPLTVWAGWPWLWSDAWSRLLRYFEFHRQHASYNMEFLGTNYNTPPFPVSYPFVMTWATVPTTLLVLAVVGLGLWLARDLRHPVGVATPRGSFMTALPDRAQHQDGVLVLGMAIFPLALIAWPSVPIFGGTKHFLTAFPFLAWAAARAWKLAWDAVPARPRRLLMGPALALVLTPSVAATWNGHPYGLSQYAPFVGGPRGAALLGLNRGFWGHAVVPFFEDLERQLDHDVSFYTHDVHPLVVEAYQREGRWPRHATPAALGPANAGGFLFYEKHMTTYEVGLWNELGTTAPVSVLSLDDVPLTSLYLRPPRESSPR